MAKLNIDNKIYEVTEGKNLLETCLSLKLDLPYFCWHPAMGSVGACRQCAVKIFKDEKDPVGKLMMSCMETVKDGLRISIGDNGAKSFREQVIEWLMTNHPHDCAVCDEGGSCHLQDMTVMTGHHNRSYHYTKRTHQNQELGPFLHVAAGIARAPAPLRGLAIPARFAVGFGELSGRGVPSRWQRSISLRMSASMSSRLM
jgi:NADH-quinone oxidoreductase subunit G